MAKQVKKVLPEDLEFSQELEKEVRIWPFKERPKFVGRITKEIEEGEPLKYGGYLGIDAFSEDQYFIPKHDRIVEAVEKFGIDKGTFEIVHEGSTKFDNGKREYNSYNVRHAPDKK